MKTLVLTDGELGYLHALVQAERDFDEESRHLSEENSDEADAVMEKLNAAL